MKNDKLWYLIGFLSLILFAVARFIQYKFLGC